MNKSFLIAAAAFALWSGQAIAADTAPPRAPAVVVAPVVVPKYNWTGYTVGIHGGWVRGIRGEVNSVPPGTTVRNGGVSGTLLGAHFGANWQTNNLVWGVEGAVSWSGATVTMPAPCMAATISCKNTLQVLTELRARVGFAADRFLVYGTGGLAWGKIERADTNTFGPASVTQARQVMGYTVGGGVAYGVSNNFVLGAEALYFNLNQGPTYPAATGGFSEVTITQQFWVARGRATFKF
jgi:outer membrane immunogenic protein